MEKSSCDGVHGWQFLLLFSKERNTQLAHAHNLCLPEAIFALAIKRLLNWAHKTPRRSRIHPNKSTAPWIQFAAIPAPSLERHALFQVYRFILLGVLHFAQCKRFQAHFRPAWNWIGPQ
jgi:hypothetical protein